MLAACPSSLPVLSPTPARRPSASTPVQALFYTTAPLCCALPINHLSLPQYRFNPATSPRRHPLDAPTFHPALLSRVLDGHFTSPAHLHAAVELLKVPCLHEPPAKPRPHNLYTTTTAGTYVHHIRGESPTRSCPAARSAAHHFAAATCSRPARVSPCHPRFTCVLTA